MERSPVGPAGPALAGVSYVGGATRVRVAHAREGTAMSEEELRKLRLGEEHQEEPTASKPLFGEKRPVWKPLIYLLLLIAALVLIYLFGLTVLVPSD